MECCFFHTKPIFRPITTVGLPIQRRPLIVVARTSYKCEYGGLSAPLEPRTPTGRILSGVLLDDRESFQVAARKELERLAAERNEAAARLQLSIGSDEACLHRRIAELKTNECEESVEDVMYMLILHKFSEIRVHLVPSLSKCAYKGRLEIWPSKDWELESIHSSEVLEMVKDHLNAFVGSRANSNVTASWETTNIKRLHLSRLYTFSILYGYLLKSVSFRHRLEWGLESGNSGLSIGACSKIPILETSTLGSKHVGFGQGSRSRSMYLGQASCGLGKKWESLRGYVKGLDHETVQMCAKPKSKESLDLIERHSSALFGDKKRGGLIEKDEELICTSIASMKRFMLEAVAFGSFLWETEKFVYASYVLEEN
ncbi:hypothetical protein ACJIZ3_012319 [Penstemon smallii]|uniref:Uncharacterized protein n=1 Tax=Penstemon smallii TaxID=265156 RepID=A0ABD3UMU4_9LAMI